MSKDETKRALVALDDDEVRANVADGDTTALAAYELTDEERALVAGAAADWPEVAGFGLEGYLVTACTGVEKTDGVLPAIQGGELGKKVRLAVDYVQGPTPHM